MALSTAPRQRRFQLKETLLKACKNKISQAAAATKPAKAKLTPYKRLKKSPPRGGGGGLGGVGRVGRVACHR